MADLTIDSLGDMRVVIEVDKIRDAVHFHPWNRLLAFPGLPHFDNFRFRCCDELMTTHARLHRRNVRMRSTSHPAMAVLTRDLKLARMRCMAECNRLTRARLLSLARRKREAEDHGNGNDRVECLDRQRHYCDATLSDESSVALQGPREPTFVRIASTSSGFTGGALFPHDERTCVRTAAISSFDSLS